MRLLRIISIPYGEAPANIRAAWVGVTIPLADIGVQQPSLCIPSGVLGKEHGFVARIKRFFGVPTTEQPSVGYVVEVLAAIEALRAKAPAAAAWWEQHTPHLVKPGGRFVFDASCCEELPSVAP